MNRISLPPHLQNKLYSHAELVRRLYKESLKNYKSIYPEVLNFRYHAVILRNRFDENKNIKDFAEAKRLLNEGWAELNSKMSPEPFQYHHCPGGIGYQREYHYLDFHLDNWHPLEKQQYPDFFAKRDERKKEYIEKWIKKYGKSDFEDH